MVRLFVFLFSASSRMICESLAKRRIDANTVAELPSMKLNGVIRFFCVLINFCMTDASVMTCIYESGMKTADTRTQINEWDCHKASVLFFCFTSHYIDCSLIVCS